MWACQPTRMMDLYVTNHLEAVSASGLRDARCGKLTARARSVQLNHRHYRQCKSVCDHAYTQVKLH